MTKTNWPHEDKKSTNQLTETEQNFLRAARAGDAGKVIELLNSGININLSNAIGLTALHLASKEGFVGIVDELLNRGADFDAPTKKGNTALHIASLAGHFDVVRLLLDAGANVNRQSVIGFTPLYMAAQENHYDVVDLLLKRGANQALTTEDGFTPLAVALQQGHERVVTLLLERDSRSRGGMPAIHIAARKDDVNAVNLLLNNSEVNVNHQSQPGFTPLHICAHYGNVSVARLLIERGADVNFQAKNNITPLHVAAKWGRGGMVQLLLAASALVDCRTRDGLTPLHCAARSGHADLAALLMDAGANPSSKTRNGLTPLHMAAQGNNEEVARILIMRGASVADRTGDSLTPLHVAAHCGNTEVARVLLDNRCDINARALNGFTPLHIACKKQKIRVVELLLQYGAHINMTTESGLSALHVAAFIGSSEIVQLLIQRGAVVNQATMRCETALHLAARNQQLDVAQALIYHGATVDAKARDDQTPLHLAVLIGSSDLVALLLSAKANPNLQARDANTALHIAAKEGRLDIMRLLLDAGADPTARTKKGFTPLHLAAKRGQLKAAKQLIHANPKIVNAVGQNDLTPLHVATHYNHLPVVELLLKNDAYIDCRAGNGYGPLHMAAKRNHIDIATLLLVSVSDSKAIANAQSRNGFTPLHLAALEGHTDMISLLLVHGADPNHQSSNGLAPLHLAAQEDHVSVAQILVVSGATVSPLTRAGYSPLHTACHFGQIQMVRYLLDLSNAPDINQRTHMGFTPLHLATQQGHSQVVQLLLEMGADSNLRNQQGLTPAHIARKQHYVTIFDILKKVTTTVVSWEEEQEELDTTLVLDQPDYMRDHPFTEFDEEGAPSPSLSPKLPKGKPKTEDSLASTGSVGDQKSRTGTYTLYFDPSYMSAGENEDIWGQLEYMRSTLSDENNSEQIAAQTSSILESAPTTHYEQKQESNMYNEVSQPGTDWELETDNVAIIRKPVTAGFLVSFVVDARGGLIQAQRYPDLRFLIPPNVINGPVRIVCRMVHPDRTNYPPALNDGDGLACRLMEIGPAGTRFSSPIVLEVPHYAFLAGKNREIVVLRSENGEIWKEHPLDCTDQAIQDTLNGNFDYITPMEELKARSVHRILTYDLPQYFALVTRVRQELILIGPEGDTLTSTVVPEVQVQFPPGALQKRIRVGLQVHPIEQELVARMLGPHVSVSPIVTIEPRRRKFHKPITLTIPLPKTAISSTGPSAKSRSVVDSPNLRLLCSITGGTSPAVWEDITGSSPLSSHGNTVSFTSTVSARLWLVDCPNITEVVELASRVYHESLAVPYIGQFIVYARRHHPEEAQLRCLCLTDDNVDKTLESQEGFQLIASGPKIEVLDDHPHWIETAGNLVPVAKTEEQLQLGMHAFRENRLNMVVRVKDLSEPAIGKLAFMRHPRAVIQAAGGALQKPVTIIEARLPDELSAPMTTGQVLKTTDIDDVSPLPYENQTNHNLRSELPAILSQHEYYAPSIKIGYHDDSIAKSELSLRQVASYLGPDWRNLAICLGLSEEDINNINSEPGRTDEDYAYASLLVWQDRVVVKHTAGTQLAEALRQIGRDDILEICMFNIAPVTSDAERNIALRALQASEKIQRHDYSTDHLSDTSGIGQSVDTTAPVSDRLDLLNTDSELIQPKVITNGRRYYHPATTDSEFYPNTQLEQTHKGNDETVVPETDALVDTTPDTVSHFEGKEPVQEEIVIPMSAERNRQDLISDKETEPHHHQIFATAQTANSATDLDSEIRPIYYPRLGDLEATWGQMQEADESTGSQQQTILQNFQTNLTNKADTDDKIINDDSIIAPTYYPRVGELEATWGKAQEPVTEITDKTNPDNQEPDTESGSESAELSLDQTTTTTTTTMTGLHRTIPNQDLSDANNDDMELTDPELLPSFDDAYYETLNELLQPRSLLQPIVPLTPIPEVSEYSVRSSMASMNPGQSWDSFDFSPSESVGSRSNASRRLLHQIFQNLPTTDLSASFDAERHGRTLLGPTASDFERVRRSFESRQSEGILDPTGSPVNNSSRSSLLEFLRLETSCDGSRADLSEEERYLISGQHDLSLRDLVSSIQAFQKQHLDETTGLATLAGGEDSSSSHLAAGSGEAERLLSATNEEMLRNTDEYPSVALVSSMMAAQMQQLIQSVSLSSSSISSIPHSSVSISSIPSTSISENPPAPQKSNTVPDESAS